MNLTPEIVTSSNVLLQVYLLAVQVDAAKAEIEATKLDQNIVTARPETLEANWGTLVQASFERGLSASQYRGILLGLIAARIKAPSKASLRQTVLAYAPSATIVIRDYFNDAPNFIGPDPATFFTLNSNAAGNVWNNPNQVWTPGRLLRQLGFDPFGTQVQVTSVSNSQEIEFLDFVPRALEFVRPAHQFVALIFDREIAGP